MSRTFKFLIDENVPAGFIKTLKNLGHDAVRVRPTSSDIEIAHRSKSEDRILVTLDKDFTNVAMYPPTEFNIVHIQIHPPYQEDIAEAFAKLLNTLSPDKLNGLIILRKSGHIKVLDSL